jgi:aminocarboxymuconate-semialdehyde decarboxylase
MSELFDVHAHYVSPALIERLAQEGAEYGIAIADEGGRRRAIVGGRPAALPFLPKLSDVVERLAWMDGCGIRRQLVASWMDLAGYHLPAPAGAWFARAQNESLAAFVASHRERFSAAAMVPLQDPVAAAAEVRHAVRTLGLEAVQIGTSVAGRGLDDPAFDPFWAALVETNVPLIIHPAELEGSEQARRFFLHILVGNPSDTTAAAAALIFGGVLERFPALRVLLVHGGGFVPYQFGRLERGFSVAPPQYRAKSTRPPSAFLGNFFFDTIVHDHKALRYLVDTVGAERVLVGTDYPFPLQDLDPEATLAELSGAERTLIGSRNACEHFCCARSGEP